MRRREKTWNSCRKCNYSTLAQTSPLACTTWWSLHTEFIRATQEGKGNLTSQFPKHTIWAHPALAGITILGEGQPREAEVRNKKQPPYKEGFPRMGRTWMHFAESCQLSPTVQPEGGNTRPKVMGESHLGDTKRTRGSRTTATKYLLLERKDPGGNEFNPTEHRQHSSFSHLSLSLQ